MYPIRCVSVKEISKKINVFEHFVTEQSSDVVTQTNTFLFIQRTRVIIIVIIIIITILPFFL